ncbi:hypothetical protein ACSBM8_08655 [Sphingomonas sp. ASY06-1R]|jgi:hypothetical protein|uniref:hypothetical protein n=1 Tax=Sphingomonas sp. ASY06-1R TaxID=3445771 RepID=UPI003FA229FB
MLGKWFNRKATAAAPSASDKQAMLADAVAERRKHVPLAGAQVAAKEVLNRAMDGSRDERGVHVETLFMALGALAGFACQMSVRAVAAQENRAPAFTIATTIDGQNRFFGDALNAPLAEEQYSVWSLAAAGVQTAGGTLPDLHEIFGHVAATVGTPAFGRPRFPDGTGTNEVPETIIASMWPSLLPMLQQFCGAPPEWPIACGIAIQEAIALAGGAIAPGTACQIAMETAVAMSKIDPAEVGVIAG